MSATSKEAARRFVWAEGDIVFVEDEERSAAYNPDQARVPAGHPDGGQWTDGGSEYMDAIGPHTDETPYEDSKRFYDEGSGEMVDGEKELEFIQSESRDTFVNEAWGDNGLPTPSEAKRSVAQAIGAHLQTQFTEKELYELAELTGVPVRMLQLNPATGKHEMLPYKTKAKLAEDYASRIVQQWAASSGDNSPLSVLIQEATRQEFALEDAGTDHLSDVEQAWVSISTGSTRGFTGGSTATGEHTRGLLMRSLRAHVRAQYEETQQRLADADIDSVELVRGVGLMAEDALDVVKTGNTTLQPASSFSTDYHTARNFAMGSTDPQLTQKRPVIIRSRIPRQRILSYPRTGFGALNENEVVVLGGHLSKTRAMVWW